MVIVAGDSRWNSYIEKLPRNLQDIYFTSQYHQFVKNEAYMFVYEGADDKIGIYPFIKRPIYYMGINGTYSDIETVYGYGGPLVNSTDGEFNKEFEAAFLKYCQDDNIVAEFVRFHPLIKNETIFTKNIKVLHNRKTVTLDLTAKIDDIWMNQISTQNRNVIRKCVKNNLKVVQSDNYKEFVDIYLETMEKVGADEFYSFDADYFNKMKQDKNCILLAVMQEGRMIAAAIFMGYGDFFHYHLSGSRRDALKLSPNNILLWEAIKYAKEQGYKRMHFGGGLTDSMEDNLFKFKSRFSKEYVDFYIGKRIHNREIYDKLISFWEKEHNEKAKILLQYHN